MAERATQRHVVLVEDNDEHAELVEFLMEQTYPALVLERFGEAESALRRLKEGSPAPRLILLDLKLPGMSGLDLLAEIKSEPSLSATPAVMLTTSNSAQDRARAFENHANAYLVKPMDFKEFKARIETTLRFWLDHADGL
ncbi:MAG: response regulator [Nannocystales bacterium]